MSDLSEVLRKVMEYRLADVRTAMPVRVARYDVATQTVDVTPLVREITETEDEDIEEALPLIPSVPVASPRAGGFFVTFPIVPGDTGQIVICDRSIDQWRARGSNSFTPQFGYAVDPLDKRKHALSGAVFYPGLSDSLSPLLDAHATNLVIGKDGGSSIHIKPTGEVTLGEENPVEKALLGTVYRTAQGTLNTALNTGWAGLATGFTALATVFGVLAADPAHAAVAAQLTTAAAACTAAATVATTTATAVSTFESTAASNQDFQSNTVKTAR